MKKVSFLKWAKHLRSNRKLLLGLLRLAHTSFQGAAPESLFHFFAPESVEDQYDKWLQQICHNIWAKMIPSTTALKLGAPCMDKERQILHHQWATAGLKTRNLPLIGSQENIQGVRKRVDLLLKGCACKTNRCSRKETVWCVAQNVGEDSLP